MSATGGMTRHYISVGGRRVHYRRMGEGPPLIMMHGSPGDGAVLADEMAAASAQFTCIVLDAPGFGGSDPLPGDTLTMADLARATAETITALGLPPTRIYGTHTGAAIGVELAAGWPERVSGAVLEGLPVFTEAEIKALFEGYFAPMIPDPLGGHFTTTWIRFRDQFTWFPWRSRDVTRLNPVDRPTPEEIELWVSMFYRSCKTYGPAYKAACYYGHGAYLAADASHVPTVYLASAEDMLFPHLDRLPPMKPGQSLARLPYDPHAKHTAIAGFAAALPGGADPAPPSRFELAGVNPAKGYATAPRGQVFVRAYGDPANPALILLHDAPGTGLALEGLARELATELYVLVPDLPANGESDAPPEDADILEAGADAIVVLADAVGLTRFAVAGIGCGATVAAVFAARRDPRLTHLVVQALPSPDEAAAAAIAPPLPLTPEGSHWIKAWLMLRDGQIYSPWFDGRVSAQRHTQGNFDADWLHDQTTALMRSRETYHRLPQAAHLYDAQPALASTTVPIRQAVEGELATAILSSLKQP